MKNERCKKYNWDTQHQNRKSIYVFTDRVRVEYDWDSGMILRFLDNEVIDSFYVDESYSISAHENYLLRVAEDAERLEGEETV